ncbi:MAG: DGQHR domain-containing protein [Planctomycetes bacterium]|nr:DGQHR domain-containing protein [Planctomycetota bacterium]
MQFFFADNVDTVNPEFDFDKEISLPNRNRQSEDVYAHELLEDPPYDGMLISRSIIGGDHTKGRYTASQRFRLFREGAREFLRFPYKGYDGDPQSFPIMGDCGAFSYMNRDVPPYSAEQILDFYETCNFTHGVSPDHIISLKNQLWDNARRRPDWISARAEYTVENAKQFLQLCRQRKSPLIPIGVVQSWSPNSAARFATKLVDYGYNYIGLGGLAGRPTREIYDTICEVRSKIPDSVKVHLFGFNRLNRLEEFQGLNITSIDSTSPLLQAIKSEYQNYFSLEDKHYLAIRVPQLDAAKIKNRIQSGDLDFETTTRLERNCLRAVYAYSNYKCNIEVVLDNICKYEKHLKFNKNHRQLYKRTLLDRPWEACPCQICKDIGIDVIIYRGLNRNKRRGFHNLYLFHKKLGGVRTMPTLSVPCIKTEQNPGKVIFSFVVNGKDIPKFTTISRISRKDNGQLLGYQRPEIVEHISDIKMYLEKSNAVLPNSIVIAFNKKLKFGEKTAIDNLTSLGILELPIEGKKKIGWIVDGQQRVAALRQVNRNQFPVSVIGFESNGIEQEREQFVLVNNTKPLPKSLLYELLPTLDTSVPPKLRKRQKAYRILELLNHESESPFHMRIKTMTSRHLETANIKDMSVLKMIENSSENGILYKFNGQGKRSFKILSNYWSAVKTYYKEAWNLPPRKSRLTHGVGIVSMGYLMDTISYRLSDRWEIPPTLIFLKELRILGADLPWTGGSWRFGKEILLPWDAIQNTNRHIDLVTNFLIRLYSSRRRKQKD